MEPAGQDSEVLIAARNGHSTAPFAPECQSFLDNLRAGFGAKGSANDPADKLVPPMFIAVAIDRLPPVLLLILQCWFSPIEEERDPPCSMADIRRSLALSSVSPSPPARTPSWMQLTSGANANAGYADRDQRREGALTLLGQYSQTSFDLISDGNRVH
jgi:hypothetical protein